MNHTLNPFGKLHKRAELREAGDRPFYLRTDWKFRRCIGPRIAERLLQPERHSPLRRIHTQDHDLDDIARLDHVARLADLLRPRHLREVDHAFDAGFEFHKRAEVGDPRHLAAHALAGRVFSCHSVPRMRLQLFHAKRDALPCRLDLQHLRVDLLPHCQYIGWLVDAAPGDVADVQQTVHSADFDERAVVGQAAHGA